VLRCFEISLLPFGPGRGVVVVEAGSSEMKRANPSSLLSTSWRSRRGIDAELLRILDTWRTVVREEQSGADLFVGEAALRLATSSSRFAQRRRRCRCDGRGRGALPRA